MKRIHLSNHVRTAFTLLLLVSLPLSLAAKKGKGNGGGGPGGDDPGPSTPPNPAFVFPEISKKGEGRLVVANLEGSNKTSLHEVDKNGGVGHARFVPGANAIVFQEAGAGFPLRMLTYSVSETAVTVDEIVDSEVDPNGRPSEPEISPDVTRVVFTMSLVGSGEDYGAVFLKPLVSDGVTPVVDIPRQYIWGGVDLFGPETDF